jgi:hypothetical protein
MKIRYGCAFALAGALLAGCVSIPYSEAYHTRVIETWVGKDVAALWQSWGPPAKKVAAPDGKEYHVYNQKLGRPADSSDESLDVAYAMSTSRRCETYFVVNPQTRLIEVARWRGSSCQILQPSRVRSILKIPQPTGF